MNRWILLRLVLGIGLVFAVTATTLAEESTPAKDPERLNELVNTAEEKERKGDEVRILVKLGDIDDQAAVTRLAKEHGANVHIQFKSVPLLSMTSGPEGLIALANSPLVEGIVEDIPQPPALNNTIPHINGDDVHDLGWTGSDYTVAILDTGIDANHDFFGGRVVSEACYSNAGGGGSGTTLCPDNSNAQTGAGSADATIGDCVNAAGNNICDHGTHVAGIAAGAADGILGAPGDGVAPDAGIIAIQVFTRFDDAGDCSPNPAPCVLTYAADQISGLERVADLSDDFDIASANMSLGGGESATACDGDSRKDIIDDLLALDIATVISAGNDGFLNSVGAPGCISTAVTVGSTTNADNVSGFSNRGPLLDIFAPGSGVNSAVIQAGTDFNFKGGTSMAAPHVTGAFAVLRDAYPSADAATLLNYMQTTGVPITYDIDDAGEEQETTPRLDLLASLQEGNEEPDLTVDENPVTVDEGDTAINTGTYNDPEGDPVTLEASVGTVSDDGGGNWSWSFETRDGPDESQTVTITGTDDKGESGEVSFELNVENVDPTVTIQNDDVTIDEGESVTVDAIYTDPGWVDTHTAGIDWGHADLDAGPILTPDPVEPPEASGTVTATQQFGDRGEFEVTVTVTDKDGGVGTDSFTVTVNNVDPTAEIDTTDAENINGEPTFLAQAGETNTFSGRSTDPGSDDLTLFWDWDDGTTDDTPYLVNPPAADPFPSPSVQPRDVTDVIDHTFADACFYLIGFWAEDDDGGVSPTDNASVIIVGNADQSRSAGYWQHQYRGNGRIDLTSAQLECYLLIAEHMSTVFDEERAANTLDEAHDVLFVQGNGGDMTQQLDRQILTAWLNFANGAIGYDELVDTTGDGVGDTPFSDVIATAESVRLDPNATRADLEAQKDILELVNGS